MGDVIRLSHAEKLIVLRNRLGLSQRQMAFEEDVSLRRLQRMEAGEAPLTPSLRATSVADLRGHERCLIMRLRAGWTQQRVAQEAGWCRRWVMLMETGRAPCHELISFWES